MSDSHRFLRGLAVAVAGALTLLAGAVVGAGVTVAVAYHQTEIQRRRERRVPWR